MVCEVIVDIGARSVNKPFDYHIPPYLEGVLEVGCRVKVFFNGRLLWGVVIKIKDHSSFTKLADVIGVLDIIPTLNQELIDIAYKMHKNYLSHFIRCLDVMIPNALKVNYQKILEIQDRNGFSNTLQKLFPKDKMVITDTLNPYLKEIKEAINQNKIVIKQELKDKVQIKKALYLSLIDDRFEPKDEVQKDVINYIKENKEVLESDIVEMFAFSRSRIKTLVNKKILQEERKEVYRNVEEILERDYNAYNLNNEQQTALNSIRNFYGTNKTILLKGVTGSGKTEVYLKIITDMLKRNKTAILLVPEISLTAQIASRMKGIFASKVAVLHSGLSDGERYDEWRRIIKKEAQVLVGARSAIFAPLSDIGAIIIDEAHEESYKQDVSPKYDALAIARMRAKNHQAVLVLGTATPKIEQYYQALNGQYALIEMNGRVKNLPLPKVETVNMTNELKKGNRSIFSYKLQLEIQKRLDENQQVMLLINRRGHSNFVMCRSCGEVIMCPNCDISLTFHKNDDILRCHHCGHEEKNPQICPKCGSNHIKYVGIGTQKVAEELNKVFPKAKVLRMDTDTTSKKGSHEKLLKAFKNHQADILVGTQMIAKGLDFPKVTLVGIIVADMILKYPTYKASFLTYSLLEQVSGRAGRHIDNGLVVIQTFNDDHYAITSAQKHDYKAFYDREIIYRRVGKYPPYYRMFEIEIRGFDDQKTFLEAYKITNEIKSYELNDLIMLGPIASFYKKINNKYLYLITLKVQNPASLLKVLDTLYQEYQTNADFDVIISSM